MEPSRGLSGAEGFEESALLPRHEAACVSVRFSPSGRLLASASADRSALVYDAHSMQYCAKLFGQHTAGLNDCAFSRDALLFTASDDKTIRVWDVAQQQALSSLTGHTGYVNCLAVNPRSDVLVSGGYDGQIRLWDHRLKSALVRVIDAHSEPVSGVDFSEDGTEFVSGSLDGQMRVWRTGGGLCALNVQVADAPPVSGVRFYSSKVGKQYLLFSLLDSTVRMSEIVRTNTLHPALSNVERKRYSGHVNEKHCMLSDLCRLSGPEGERLCVVSGSEDGAARVWDMNRRTLEHTLAGHAAPVIATACNPRPDGPAQIVTADLTGVVKVWTQRSAP